MMQSFLKEFRAFAMRGNVIDLAVGVIIGGAFGQIVNSLVNDIIMPPIGRLIGGVDFTNLFINLSEGDYQTLEEAQAAGAATINYGIFLNTVINFLIIAFVIFLLIRQINRLQTRMADDNKNSAEPTTKECPFCISAIPYKAIRCPHCTSHLDKTA